MTLLKYRDREIDLKPYFQGFPYFRFFPSEADGMLYYFHRGETIRLLRTPLVPHPSLESGEPVSDLDFGSFTAWGMRYQPEMQQLIYTGDEQNDEILNLYALDPESGRRRRLTGEEYIYGANIDDPHRMAFVGRKKSPERMISTLKRLDATGGEVTDLITDTPEWPFTWTAILRHSDSGAYLLVTNHNYDRNRSNILLFDPVSGNTEILLDPDRKRASFGIFRRWLDPDTLLFMSDETGFSNLYRYHLPSRSVTALTAWEAPLSDFQVISSEKGPLIFAVREHPVNDWLFVLNPRTGEVLHQENANGKMGFLQSEGHRLFAVTNSLDDPLEIFEIEASFEGHRPVLKRESFIRYPEALRKRIVHGTAEAVRYPTFDSGGTTPGPRMIHAFVLVPETLPERPEDRRAIITAFYGGENRYNTDYHIYLQAGIIVMSPAVRGSWGFGAEFYSLNDRDLGGNEIIDLIYAGRYLCRRFGLKESQVGLEGGSHGGYCAMRGLTFPEEVNGRQEHFAWGFAISSYGISNVVEYYDTCNIPDWVLQKAGDPKTESEKLMDRSPLRHAHRATGPLLLVHGEKDSRVPVEQSRQMARAMEKAGKPYRYVEIPGQGHGWMGLQENLRYFREVFSFLETV